MIDLCWGGASVLAPRGASTTAGTSGWTFGSATSTSGDVMSGAGAGVDVRICVGLVSWDSGRPTRWVVIIAGPLFSSVAFVTNINAVSTEPTAAR